MSTFRRRRPAATELWHGRRHAAFLPNTHKRCGVRAAGTADAGGASADILGALPATVNRPDDVQQDFVSLQRSRSSKPASQIQDECKIQSRANKCLFSVLQMQKPSCRKFSYSCVGKCIGPQNTCSCQTSIPNTWQPVSLMKLPALLIILSVLATCATIHSTEITCESAPACKLSRSRGVQEAAEADLKPCMLGCAGCLQLADLLRVQLAKLEPDSNTTEPKDELVGDVQCATWK